MLFSPQVVGWSLHTQRLSAASAPVVHFGYLESTVTLPIDTEALARPAAAPSPAGWF